MARRLGSRSRKRERQLQEALFLRFSNSVQPKLRRVIRDAMRSAADSLEAETAAFVSGSIHQHDERLGILLQQAYTGAAMSTGDRLLGEAKSYYPAHTKDAGEDLRRMISDFARTWTAMRVTEISKTTEEQIRSIVAKGLDDGKGYDVIARQIRQAAPQVAGVRAFVIARTETHTAAQFGQQASADASQLDMVKEWVAVEDSRTRTTPPDAFDHMAADGQTVEKGGMFNVSGELLKFPGDPAGSAGNIINCRCGVAWEVV